MAATLARCMCKPCELVTQCCGKLCECCEKSCGNCCKGFSNFVNTYFDRPFSCQLLFACLFTGCPAIAMIIVAARSESSICEPKDSLDIRIWNYVMALCYIITVAVTAYAFCRFRQPYNLQDPKDRNFVARFQHLICEDIVVAVYILIIVFKFVWLILGGVWLRSAKNCSGSPLSQVTSAAITFGIVYFAIAGMMLFFNFVYFTCCPASANRQYGGNRATYGAGAATAQPAQMHPGAIATTTATATPVVTGQAVAAPPQVVIHGTVVQEEQHAQNPGQSQENTLAGFAARSLVAGANALFGSGAAKR